MARLDTPDQLLKAWSKVALTADPRAALTGAGHVIAPSMSARLDRKPPGRLRPEQRARLLKELRAERDSGAFVAGRPRFAIRPKQKPAARSLPPGEFDVVASVRLEVATEVLAGLYATRVIPRGLPAGQVPLGLSQLRELSDDIPDADGLAVGALHLTAPPRAEVAPDGGVRLSQALRLDVDLVRNTAPRRTTVTSLSGVLHHDARPSARETTPGVMRIELDVHPTTPTGTEEFLIDAGSPIQARDDDALAAFTNLVVVAVRAALQKLGPVVVSPDLRLPFDRAVRVRVLAAETGTAATSTGAGALHVGVMVGFGDDAVAGPVPAGSALDSDPFRGSAVNVAVSLHEATLQAAAAASTDRLERRLNAKVPFFTAAVESATVALRPPDTIRLAADAHITDFCGPGPFNFIDLDFSLVMEVETSVFDGTIRLEGDPEVDFSNGDVALCALSALADIALLQFVDIVFVGVLLPIGIVVAHSADALDERSIDFNGVFEPHTPVPGTELAPRAEVLQVGVTEDHLILRGALTLEPDSEHIFAYVRVRQGLSNVIVGGPVAGARVRVMDQDAPAPPGDDFTPPVLDTPVIMRGQTQTIRLDLSFEPPSGDEVIGAATTDRDGMARLVLKRATAGGKGGTLVTKQTTFFTTVEKNPVRETFRTPLREELPDAYLRVTVSDGRAFDSRQSGGLGLLIDLESDHIGTAAAPIVVTLPMPPKDTVPT